MVARALLVLLGTLRGAGAQAALWTILSGSQYCEIVTNGTCVTDSNSTRYGDNELCIAQATVALVATASSFNTELGHDFVQIGTTQYFGTTGPANLAMSAGQTLLWYA
jgi:hypothetical protein